MSCDGRAPMRLAGSTVVNAVNRGRSSRRAASWPAVLIGSLVLVVAPVAGTAAHGSPDRAVSGSLGVHRDFGRPRGPVGAAGTRRDPVASVREAVARLANGGAVVMGGGTYAQQ